MKYFPLTLIIILYSLNSFCQSYDGHITDATFLYNQKKYDKSSQKWDNAFTIHKGYSSDYYNAACTNALAGNKDKAFEYLEKAIKSGWNDIEWMKNDRDLISLKDSKRWTLFIKNISSLKTEYLSSLNIKMKDRLEELRMQDQTIRLLLPDAEKRFSRNSKEYSWFRNELMPRNDSIVLTEIVDIINNNGWLGINEVGELANQTLWLVIQHAPLSIQEEYLPLLKKSVEKGDSKARYLAFLQDRILMRKNEKQIYGTQSMWSSKREKNVIWPIENAESVNERRKNVGLESIEEYADNNGFVYEPENK
ncbi:TPR end-of-group domain-containing protein [Christiangramia sp. SM2212]|uniref:Uncharacterized protein n=1 Tax=Christiangramia sediminicola TaxID=3073267 RepID=A0ABU1ERU3_9FLAO|nr:DUF6624 domain-containing protein [Christiangramia sp. SM2212]MDR5591117.1 hypothetical protein [Christiangramia sp. SM2212]